MREYLSALFAVCLISGIVKVVAPEGSLRSYVEFICAACVIACIALPVIRVLSSDPDLPPLVDTESPDSEEYYNIFEQYFVEQDAANLEAYLSDALEERLELRADSISVNLWVEGQGDSKKIAKATVCIRATGVGADPDDIVEYVEEITGAECEIVYRLD